MLPKLEKFKYSVLATVTSGGTLTLLANSEQFQIFTGTMAHSLKLPDATTTSNGSGICFSVINESTGDITILLDDNSTLTTVPTGSSKDFLLTDHSTSNGVWRVGNFAGGSGGGIGSVSPGTPINTNYTILTADKGKVLNVDSSGGVKEITLPAPVSGFIITIKDYTGSADTNNILILRNGSELIDSQATSYTISNQYEAVTLISDGTNWTIISGASGEIPPAALAVWAGGMASINISALDYVNISTLSNASAMGVLTVARASMAGCSSFTRGIFAGGTTGAVLNVIDYVTMTTSSNAIDFGDLTVARYGVGGLSNNTRGVFGGGFNSSIVSVNTIDYITIATPGNATNFGNLTLARNNLSATASNTRGLFVGGSAPAVNNTIDYITIASTGNAIDFGDLTVAREGLACVSSPVMGVFGGGYTGSASNVIDYVNFSTTSNATDFGDLTVARYFVAGGSSFTRGLFGGGNGPSNIIDYITFAGLNNAADFGDLVVARTQISACSNAHGGLI